MRSSPSSRPAPAQPVSNGLGCGGQRVCTYRLASLHRRSGLGLGSHVPLRHKCLLGLHRRILLRPTYFQRHSLGLAGRLLSRSALRCTLYHRNTLVIRRHLLRLLRRGLRRLGTHLHSAHGAAQGDLASKAEGQHRGVGCESGICTCVDKLHVHVWRAGVRYGVCALRCTNLKRLRRRSVVTDSSRRKVNNLAVSEIKRLETQVVPISAWADSLAQHK